jgi:hypothetical protein
MTKLRKKLVTARLSAPLAKVAVHNWALCIMAVMESSPQAPSPNNRQ